MKNQQVDEVKRGLRTHLAGLWWVTSKSNRSSGTGTRASFGSMVQKGKFSAGAADFVMTLKNVDWKVKLWASKVNDFEHFLTFPTLGTPTIPIFKLVPTLPINGLRSGSSAFFGPMLKIELTKQNWKIWILLQIMHGI